ncbi:uncharacterized protein LOC118774420 [Megalops cyprinoides]|uniref:uncharacterized protein LOC118774420 n=1 Tax=Megalops cyprinoides TaxID=118141 RepID=UPI0018641528|nr:uncharacterized protein LOC118774420 [Megalops cyprinoides]
MSMSIRVCLSVLLLLLAAGTRVIRSSVVDSFRDCRHFLYQHLPPTGFPLAGLQMICQRYQGAPRYATLYHPGKRIPLFSAYTFKKSEGEKQRRFPWLYEPQVGRKQHSDEMQPLPLAQSDLCIEDSQAVLADYTDTIRFERGQLNPDQHQAEAGDKAATYTLTNVVPQVKEFYRAHWSRYLEDIRHLLSSFCRGTAFVVTGVTTSEHMIRRDNRDRVAIPRHLWTAYCCPDFDLNMPYQFRYKFPSFAAYGLNEAVNSFMVEVSAVKLEAFIKREMRVEQDFQLFYRGCVPEVGAGRLVLLRHTKLRLASEEPASACPPGIPLRCAMAWPLACVLGMLLAMRVTWASVESTLPEECRASLYKGRAPAGLEHPTLKHICQRFNGKPRYITLYDSLDRIPVYSAYTFKRSDGLKRVDVPWMFEPQLSTLTDTGEMQPFPQEDLHWKFEDAQAVLEDYSNSVNFERGQLNPDEHQAEPDDKAATYTLTNVVPQVPEFNMGPWKEHEHRIRRRLNNYCRGTAYIITGVTTSGHMIRRRNMARVAIPTYMWSAYCCPDYDHNAPYDERSKFPSFASHGLNQREDSEVSEMTVQALEDFLKKVTFVDKGFQIFENGCIPPFSLPH